MACVSSTMLGIGLTGCAVGPNYQSPEIREAVRRLAPDGGGVPSRTVEGAVDIAWWKSFRDSQLSSLVERLVAQNLDLETAAERVIQSVAQRQVAAAQGLPRIEGQSATTYNRQSPNGTLSLITPAPGAPLEYALFRDGLSSSWQLDLFGRVRRAVEAADASTLAAVENRHGVALAAVAELAQSYMQLRGTQSRLGIAKRNLHLAEENVELVNTRFGNGVATTLDLAKPGLNRPPSPRPCRRCAPRRPNLSTPSDCCSAIFPASWRPSCTALGCCRGSRARFRWACPERSCAADRTCARLKRDYMKPRRRPASRCQTSIPT